jgi:uncharacterized protein YecE (DUF72 family)
MLEYYAREFRYTEVNSTYYALPSQQTMTRLAERTPPVFMFTVKAFSTAGEILISNRAEDGQ